MTDQSLTTRLPTRNERRLFFLLPLVYAALVLSVLPFAAMPGINNPAITTVAGLGILFADICTALVLGMEYRRAGRVALLWLTTAYAYGAAMAFLHLATFPGVVVEGPVIGNAQSVTWLYLSWRLGMALLLLGGVLAGAAGAVSPPRRDPVLAGVVIGSIGIAAVAGLYFTGAGTPDLPASQLEELDLRLSSVSAGLSLVGALMIWWRRAYDDALYLWLALALVAFAAELTLSVVGGAHYSVGWYVSRASWVVSNCMLLVLWLSHESSENMPRSWRAISAYGSAVCILVATLVLHWFMLPWLGYSNPFASSFASVAIAVWLGGWRPATLTAVIGYVIAGVWLTEADTSFVPADASGMLTLGLYALTCAVVIGLGEAMRQARDRLRRSTQELQRSDVNKSNFLALLSHELRNPMAPLRNVLGLLRMNPSPEELAELVPIMERQLGQLDRLVDDLLDVSRIDRGKLELSRERIALDAVIKGAIETSKPNIEAKNHRLVATVPPEPVYVDGDAVRLTQLLSNLLNNAAKFTPRDGRIEVSVRRGQQQAVVQVSDNGIGIPAHDLPRIFDIFVQLRSSLSPASAGLGIGLALARSIAEMHGGRLEARSEGPGKGSRFLLTLPLSQAAAGAVRPAMAYRAPLPASRVLVVDDNQDAAMTLAAVLRQQGHEVRVAFSGEEGLAKAGQFLPNVAFLDLNMPDLDGIQLAKKLRSDPRTRTTKLVALTGMGRGSDMMRTREAGFVAHLKKPASLDEIARLAGGGPPGGA
jgi:signal transduction histidine kinase/CheY-like chemotaxis protein